MKPDQHKKKRSAQYKRKHSKTEKKDVGSTNTPKANGPAQRAPTSTGVSQQTPAAGSQTQRGPSVNLPSKSNGFTESEGVRHFSRRKIESNWDRYEPLDEGQEDTSHDGLKGADFKTLLSQTGDVSSQFRFKDEQLWEDEDQSDADRQQSPAGFPAIDCHHLSRMLKAIPLPSRLDIDQSFFEASVLKSMEETASKHKERLDSTPAERFLMPKSNEDPSLFLSGRGSDEHADSGSVEDGKCSEDQEDEKSASGNVQDYLQYLSDVADPLDGINASPVVHEKEEQLMEDISQQAGKSSTSDSENKSRHPAQHESSRGQETFSSLDAPNKATDNSKGVEESIKGSNESKSVEDAAHISEAHRTQTNIGPITEKDCEIQQEQNNLIPDLKTELPSVSPPITEAKYKAAVAAHPSPPPKTNPLLNTQPTTAETDDDELDFLLSLENPVQTRNREVSSGIPQVGEAKEEAEVDMEREPPSSQPQGDGRAPSKTLPNPTESTVSAQNASSNLEDWLDSMLDD